MGSYAPEAAVAASAGRRADDEVDKPLSRNENVVYAALRNAHAPLKAYALLEILYDEGLRAPMTIYRALEGLIERGLARKIASLNAFMAVDRPDAQSVGAFITCRRCGRTRQIAVSEHLVSGLFAPASMAIANVFIEAYGDCVEDPCAARDEA